MKFDPALEPHCVAVAEDFAQARRRVGILAGRRATENQRDPIDAAHRAQLLFDALGHVSRIAQVVDEIAGPLNRAAFQEWLSKRERERAERVRLLLTSRMTLA